MLEAYPGVMVAAFINPDARGTWDCIRRAVKLKHQVVIRNQAGKVIVYTPDGDMLGGDDPLTGEDETRSSPSSEEL
jgi:hypothetical protein